MKCRDAAEMLYNAGFPALFRLVLTADRATPKFPQAIAGYRIADDGALEALTTSEQYQTSTVFACMGALMQQDWRDREFRVYDASGHWKPVTGCQEVGHGFLLTTAEFSVEDFPTEPFEQSFWGRRWTHRTRQGL